MSDRFSARVGRKHGELILTYSHDYPEQKPHTFVVHEDDLEVLRKALVRALLKRDLHNKEKEP